MRAYTRSSVWPRAPACPASGSVWPRWTSPADGDPVVVPPGLAQELIGLVSKIRRVPMKKGGIRASLATRTLRSGLLALLLARTLRTGLLDALRAPRVAPTWPRLVPHSWVCLRRGVFRNTELYIYKTCLDQNRRYCNFRDQHPSDRKGPKLSFGYLSQYIEPSVEPSKWI